MKKLLLFFFLILIIASCSTTKYVKENELLLTKNVIYIDSLKTSSSEIEEFIIQKPNAKVLGLPFILHFYNIGNPNGSKNVTEWSKKHAGIYNFVKKVFSEKQAVGISKSFLSLNNWFIKKGQAPVIINDEKTKSSIKNLKIYGQTLGFFKTKITAKKEKISDKKGIVNYYLEQGVPLFLDSIYTQIDSPILDSIFKTTQKKSFLKPNTQYNNQNFINEASRLTKLYRNNGVYHFNENSIGFYEIDTSKTKTNVKLKISERIIEKDGNYKKVPYKVQKIKTVNIFTDYSFSKENQTPNTIKAYKNINFISFNKLKYNPKYLSQSIFIKPNDIYKDSTSNLTRLHLRGLKNFKSISIKYEEVDDENLEANIFLTPKEKYSLGFETEISRSNIREYDVSAKLSLANRNLFKGSEILKFSVFGSYFKANSKLGWETGGDLSLEIPRFIAPFGISNFVPKRMFPKTQFIVGINIQKNIGLDKQNINAGINYKWQYNPKKTIQVDIANVQYIRNLSPHKYFDIYQSDLFKLLNISAQQSTINPLKETASTEEIVSFMKKLRNDMNFKNSHPTEYLESENILNRYNIITSNFLIPEIAYTFTYNNRKNFKDQNFSYVKFRIANSGNVLGLFSSDKKDDKNQKRVLNTPIAQYIKTDIEYKKYWALNYNAVLAFRTFLGAIFTYNGSDIPFSRSYFSGGSNDIRAWQTYQLGPGAKKSGLEYNIGSLKFLNNFEYRFDFIGNLKGALFLDAGNIWDIRDIDLVDDKSQFNSIKSFADIAVGSGLGIRYDFKFLVARLDIGFKVYEPYLDHNKWFKNHNFNKAIYNIGINYPF